MLPSNILSSLILAAAAWMGANFYKQAADDAARNHVLMTAETTPQRPAIDREAPAEFRTATFALG